MESLVPPLPQPDAERAAEALDVITQWFQSIAESHTAAETEAAAAAAKSTKPSVFSFSRMVAPVLTPTPASLSAAVSTSGSVAFPVGMPTSPTSPVRPTSTQPTAYSTVPVPVTVGSNRSPRGINNDGDAATETAADKTMTMLPSEPAITTTKASTTGVNLQAQSDCQSQSQSQDGQKDQAVQEWDHQQERLSLDQQPVSLAEGFKYW